MTNMHTIITIYKKFCKHSDIDKYNCETSKDNCDTVCVLFVSK